MYFHNQSHHCYWNNMYVVKRDGREEPINICKIIARLKRLTYGFSMDHCDPVLVARKICSGVCNGVTTTQLDELAAEIADSMSTDHPNYALLAARIAVSNLHKNTKKSFSETIKDMYNHFKKKSGEKAYFISDDVFEIVMKNAARLDSEIIYDRDFDYDYIGFKTIRWSYLLRIDGKIVERPQHMLMRVSVGIHKDDINSVLETYHLMSQRWFTHASLTLFNAGSPLVQLNLKDCDAIGKSAGGLCNSIHNQQGDMVPMLNMFDETTGCIDQGDFAIYLEPWQADINEFLDVKNNNGKGEHRVRVRYYALWIPDLFMERVWDDGKWSLFCPNESPDLAECWGEEFEKLYTQYEEEGWAKKVISARKLWIEILNSQIETGTPYILFKDFCNRKSMKQHLRTTMKSSNLCVEAKECTRPTKNVVYNLVTIALPQFVREKGGPIDSHPSKLVENRDTKNRYLDFDKLSKVTSTVAANMRKIIDFNSDPDETVKMLNFQHSRIVIGVQGLAQTFILLGMPFDSTEGRQLNKYIFETISTLNCRSGSETRPL